MTLTPAGEAFLVAARDVLARLDDAVAAARRADREVGGRLRLGFVTGAALELTGPILTAFREACPEVEVQMREFAQHDPSAGLASGVTDVAVVRLPQATPRIETEPLFTDPVVAMVARDHPLARRTSVSAHDLVGETLTLSETTDEVWRDYWGLAAARGPGERGRFVAVSSVTEETSLVAAGAAIAVTSAAVSTFAVSPGLVFVPLDDWPGSVVALAWPTGERSALVSRFVEVACTVRDRESDLVRTIESRSCR